MKFILIALIACFAAAKFLPTLDQAKDFAIGFTLTFRVLEKIPDGVNCGLELTQLPAILKTLEAEIKSGNIANMLKALETLVQVMEVDQVDCEKANVEGKDFIAEVSGLINSPDFKKNATTALYTYAEVVGRDIAEMVACEKQGDSLGAGAHLGDIARLIVWGEPNPSYLFE